ncbi:MAG: T9SS type A sorting domain-containing protein [candidate division Zixibacteria bacterium]|nr:T9SS type A sorting domain-containing protein [candidate division Zixibacteria bacterium]
MVKKLLVTFLCTAALVVALAGVSSAQVPTPWATMFADTSYSSTINGELLPIGTIIEAYDPDGVLCGKDTVQVAGAFGFMPVYGDDLSGTPALDEGAETGDPITFKVNGKTAVATGDVTWQDQTSKYITLATSATVAITAIDLPADELIAPGDTLQFRVDVRNDGDGLDFYGVKLTMSAPGGTTNFDWEALEPDSSVYATPNETVSVYFSVKAPFFNDHQVDTVTYTVYSNVDTTVTVVGSVVLDLTITDVDDPDNLLPGSFALYQNYPNPFNPTTTIAFNLSSSADVRLDIIDILGRIVESRDLGILSAGEQRIAFDGSDLASGVYFYRVQADAHAQVRKMILLK